MCGWVATADSARAVGSAAEPEAARATVVGPAADIEESVSLLSSGTITSRQWTRRVGLRHHGRAIVPSMLPGLFRMKLGGGGGAMCPPGALGMCCRRCYLSSRQVTEVVYLLRRRRSVACSYLMGPSSRATIALGERVHIGAIVLLSVDNGANLWNPSPLLRGLELEHCASSSVVGRSAQLTQYDHA